VTVIVFIVLALLSLGAWHANSLLVAVGLIVLVWSIWILLETLAVTVLLHRYLTHGSWLPKRTDGLFVRFWLWWARSGGVRFWEWVIIHAWHHAFTDTDEDSYTPWATNKNTGQPPLKAPRPWNFWMNGQSYRKFWKWLEAHPERWEKLLATNPAAAKTQAQLDQLDWARPVYGRVARANVISWMAFVITLLPLAHQVGTWWTPLLVVVLASALLGVKFVAYLTGGQIINYFGHRQKGPKHQSNLPWQWLLPTLAMLGEGWHEFHHDAPGSARFNPYADPAWWVIVSAYYLGAVREVTVAEPTPKPRVYVLYQQQKAA
jgi:fatty-acid desaturase